MGRMLKAPMYPYACEERASAEPSWDSDELGLRFMEEITSAALPEDCPDEGLDQDGPGTDADLGALLFADDEDPIRAEQSFVKTWSAIMSRDLDEDHTVEQHPPE